MTRRPTVTAPVRLADRQDAPPGSPEALLISLLQSHKPYRMPVGRRQRVGMMLGGKNRRHGAPALLRPAVVLAVLVVCGAAFASARLLGWTDWMVERYERLLTTVAPSSAPSPRLHPAGRARPMPPADRPAPTPAAAEATATPPLRVVSAASLRRRLGGHVHSGSSAAANDDDSLVRAGLQALRGRHDPVGARALLDVYLREHPDGTLAQEALAISIEAAVNHHDADAASLATRYLTRYPAGPFSALARQTLGPPAVSAPPR